MELSQHCFAGTVGAFGSPQWQQSDVIGGVGCLSGSGHISILGNKRSPRPHGCKATVKQVYSDENVEGLKNMKYRNIEGLKDQKQGRGAFYFSLSHVFRKAINFTY